VALVPDHPRMEAALEQVTPPAVALVEELRVAAVEPLHASRQVLDGRLDEQVIVRVHKAVGVYLPAEGCGDHGQQVEEVDAVDVLEEDPRLPDAVRRDVEDPVRKVSPQQACHLASTVARLRLPNGSRAPFVTQSSHSRARSGPAPAQAIARPGPGRHSPRIRRGSDPAMARAGSGAGPARRVASRAGSALG
jgi:hypothetical protein